MVILKMLKKIGFHALWSIFGCNPNFHCISDYDYLCGCNVANFARNFAAVLKPLSHSLKFILLYL